MASVERNLEMWDREYPWPDGGDEWSSGWGGPSAQWAHWVEPRLDAALGDRDGAQLRVVEIGCGHGRWTTFLAERFAQVWAYDLSSSCVEVCRRRFADSDNVVVRRCDGTDLPGVEDSSVDLVVSIDSLVHADAAAMSSYVAECARVLVTDGVAVLHHSNLAACGLDRHRLLERPWLRRLASAAGLVEENVHWRDPSVDADLVVRAASRNGLVCTHQELLRWGTRRCYTDCISVLAPASVGGRSRVTPPRRVRNDSFVEEMAEVYRRGGR